MKRLIVVAIFCLYMLVTCSPCGAEPITAATVFDRAQDLRERANQALYNRHWQIREYWYFQLPPPTAVERQRFTAISTAVYDALPNIAVAEVAAIDPDSTPEAANALLDEAAGFIDYAEDLLAGGLPEVP
jgi:hypothetical protein